MKQISNILLIISLFMALSVSCNKDGEQEQPEKPVIKVEITSIEAAHQSAEYRIRYSVENAIDGEVLTVTPDVDWIQDISVESQEILFTVADNTSGSVRKGNINLEYTDSDKVIVVVSQVFNPAEINLSAASTKCDYKGGDFNFNVTVQNPIEGEELVVSQTEDWIGNLTMKDDVVYFSIDENNSGIDRSGKIEMKYGESSISHIIEQSFVAAEIEMSSSETYDCDGGNQSIPYSIINPRNDAELSVICDAEWITDLKIENDKVTFYVGTNDGGERSTVMKVTYPTSDELDIAINQKEAEYSSVNLSKNGTANSYIVSASGEYMFQAVKGNGTETVGEISSVEVLWESFGTETTPDSGELISSPKVIDAKFISFTVPQPYKEGNAVIAAKDAAGNILWSWHIWLTDAPEDQVYNNGAGIVMDRNLGAVSDVPGEVGALGLLYQWGRKDPFLGSASRSKCVPVASTLQEWPSPETSTSQTGNIEYATMHPTTFILCNKNNKDWYYAEDNTTDDTRWQSQKTVYDPCPPGYRVPEGGENGLWAKAFGSAYLDAYGCTNNGFDFGSSSSKRLTDSSPSCWYPFAGAMDYDKGSLDYVGYIGKYWSCTVYKRYAADFFFGNNGNIYASSYMFRASAYSVRCVKE